MAGTRIPMHPWTGKMLELLRDFKEHNFREIYDYVQATIPDDFALDKYRKNHGKPSATYEEQVAAGKKYTITNYLSHLLRSHRCVAKGENWERVFRLL
jgi:hypothetical protein